MASASTFVLFGIIAVVGYLILRRATELFCIRVEGGQARHVRGRLPPALLSDMCDVLSSSGVQNAVVRAVSEGGKPRLVVDGDLHPDHVQRLRNVLGRFKIAQIRSGRKPRA